MGMVRQAPGLPSQFTPLGDWMRERSMFYSLRSLRFFKYFKIAKAYRFWYKNVRYKLYCQQRNKLKARLFLAKHSFVSALIEMNQLCVDMRESTKLVEATLKSNSSYTTEEFDSLQQSTRIEAARIFEATQEKLQAALEKVCEDVTTRARVSDGSAMPGEGGDEMAAQSGKSKSMFAMRQAHLERQRALKKAEEEAQMLGDFIRLADYILVENLVMLAIDSVGTFLNLLIDNKQQEEVKRKAMFLTHIDFVPGDIEFHPPKEAIGKTLRDMQEGVINTVNAVARLLYNRGFKPFFEGQHVVGPAVESIIVSSAEYIEISNGLDEQLHTDFDDARVAVEDYEQYRKVHDFGDKDGPQYWDYEQYMSTGPSPREMQNKMKQIKTWQSDVKERMRKQKLVGMLHIDGKQLQLRLEPITTDALQNMKVMRA